MPEIRTIKIPVAKEAKLIIDGDTYYMDDIEAIELVLITRSDSVPTLQQMSIYTLKEARMELIYEKQ